MAHLAEEGYGCRPYWKPLSQQDPYRNREMRTDTSKAFWLPSSFTLTDDDVKKVIGIVTLHLDS